MGLDVTAYTKLIAAQGNEAFDETGELKYDEENWFQVYDNDDFPGRLEGLQNRHAYKSDEDTHGFRAGSYGGYNTWRNQLAELAGYPAIPVDRYKTGNVQSRHDEGAWQSTSGPFWELINFSDCEGTIGPVVSAKLAKDFADFQEKADAHTDEYFKTKYADWRKAFDMAADGGCVDFH